MRAAGDYDYDVVVVGAGPAGLAAAIRLRWVKGYEPAPASVLLVDPDDAGGLARMGGCVLTGPGWATNGEGLLPPLLGDVERLQIGQVRRRAVGIARGDGGVLVTTLDDGRRVTSAAMIVATGFRATHEEARYFGANVHLAYKGLSHLAAIVEHAARDAAKGAAAGRAGGLVVIGHEASLEMLEVYEAAAETAGHVTLLLQGHPTVSTQGAMGPPAPVAATASVYPLPPPAPVAVPASVYPLSPPAPLFPSEEKGGVRERRGVTIRWGTTLGYVGERAGEGEGKREGGGEGKKEFVRAVRFREAASAGAGAGERAGDGEKESEEVACGAVFVDYHAFERRAELSCLATTEGLNIARTAAGFVAVDARMATSEAGVFAAGDATGRYASTLMAMGDGVCAGFSALGYLHRRKFGEAAALFAYAAEEPYSAARRVVPAHVGVGLRLVLLGPREGLVRAWQGEPLMRGDTARGDAARGDAARGDAARLDAAMACVERRATVGELMTTLHATHDEVAALCRAGLYARALTLHGVADATHDERGSR